MRAAEPQGLRPFQATIVRLSREFRLTPINWKALPELPARLARHGLVLERSSVTLSGYPDSVEVDSLDAAQAVVQGGLQPWAYVLHLYCKKGENVVSISLMRGTNVHGQEFQTLSVTGLDDTAVLSSVADFLGLEADSLEATPASRPRSVFVAHRFDDMGNLCAEKLARFLELLGFRVVTGRGFAPSSVAEKVRKRLLSQGVVIAILTRGDDSTWLVQESVLAEAHGKPLIVLRDISAEFKAGILGDLEFIPFEAPSVESAFIPMLEGLRELGYSLDG